jgi:hypothetical protein
VDVILTDVTQTWLDLRAALRCMSLVPLYENYIPDRNPYTADYEKITARYSRVFLWTTFRFYSPVRFIRSVVNQANLERVAGPFGKLRVSSVQVALARVMAWWLGVKL